MPRMLWWLLSDMKKLLAIATVAAFPLLADDRSKETLGSTHTDRFKVAAAGAIRLENSFGEVDIDGWDRPEVEVTVVRSTEHLYDSKQRDSKQPDSNPRDAQASAQPQRHRDEAQRRLDSVQITAKQDGNDVVISTAYPPLNGFTHPLSRRSDIQISYRINAPRASQTDRRSQ